MHRSKMLKSESINGGSMESISPEATLLENTRLTAKLWTLDDIWLKIGIGRFHYLLIWVCGCGYIVDNMWTAALSVILLQVQYEFDVSAHVTSLIPSIYFLGMLFGSLFWGRMSDVLGRAAVFTYTLTISGALGLFAAFSLNIEMLFILYFLLGTGVGGNLPVDAALLAEFLPSNRRGAILAFLSVFWGIGSGLTGLLGYLIMPSMSCADPQHCEWHQNEGWRYLLGCLGFINILMIFCRLGMPESPAFLLKRQDIDAVDEVFDIVQNIARRNGKWHALSAHREHIVHSLTALHDDATDGGNEQNAKFWEMKKSLHRLFEKLPKRNLALATPLMWIAWFLTNFGYTCVNMFLPELIDNKKIEAVSLYTDYFYYTMASIPGSLLGALLVESKLGRKWSMVAATVTTGASMFYFAEAHTQIQVVIGTCVLNFAAQIMYAGLFVYTPEMYPADVRTTGTGIATAVSRFAGLLAPVVASLLIEEGDWALFVAAACLGVATIALCALPFDTSGKMS